MKPGVTISSIIRNCAKIVNTTPVEDATTDREAMNTKEQSLNGTLEIMNTVEPIAWIGMD